ncbi:hypothetical protein O0I10_004207 [Lichtheimia ornata]|uniref:DASH complex subunit DAD1 n=1 Tax=Lichtheimia ornata TaxID=688661 RepID=A0AAD7V6Z3_9FUNG|nr:uncharacterized protein O0I10_004207 [Lichtheimia ornata]KAJ8659980.1 hypothetical protein O0I10_004207 [Lichtheimia ornata]
MSTRQETFQAEQAALLEKTHQGLDQLFRNLNQLHGNLEQINTVGKGFHYASDIWHDFYSALKEHNDSTGSGGGQQQQQQQQ